MPIFTLWLSPEELAGDDEALGEVAASMEAGVFVDSDVLIAEGDILVDVVRGEICRVVEVEDTGLGVDFVLLAIQEEIRLMSPRESQQRHYTYWCVRSLSLLLKSLQELIVMLWQSAVSPRQLAVRSRHRASPSGSQIAVQNCWLTLLHWRDGNRKIDECK